MSEPKYENRTKRGCVVVGTWKSDGCYGPTNALVLRELPDGGTDLVVALGYRPETGDWGQGRHFGGSFVEAIDYARATMAGRVVNGVQVTAGHFFFDGCHKFYLVEDEEDIAAMESVGWDPEVDLHPIEELPSLWDRSCPLRFISTVKLEEVVPQFFEGDPFKDW